MTHPASASRRQRAAWPTVLVTMPFMDADRPSIQLGLLKAIGQAQDFPIRTLHANLDFAARIGADYYRALSEARAAGWSATGCFPWRRSGKTAPDRDGRLRRRTSPTSSRYVGPSPARAARSGC